MSLVIRFAKIGRKGERKYQIVVKEQRSRRDGRAIDIVGSYEKRVSGEVKSIDKKKLSAWLEKGAHLSEGVKKIV